MTRALILLFPAVSALALAACTPPHPREAVAPIAASAVVPAGENAPLIAADWWTALGDPQLDRIMADALAGNPRLDMAAARLRAAQAVLAGARAEDRPQVGADVNEQFTRLSDKYIIPPPYGGSWRWVGQAQANLSWNLDFWGRQAAAIRQAARTADAARIDIAAARLSLTGAIAQTYVELARAERQIALAAATVEQRDTALRLARIRVQSRLASDIDLRAAETILAQARQAQLRAEGQRETVVHALAMLAGKGADYYATVQPASIKLDAALPLPATLPADLLSRRPDVASAQARIAAATEGRQVARRAYYPNVNLLGVAGLQALGIGNLFSGGAATYGGGAAVHLPIFEGGRLRANLEQSAAALDSAVADYNQAVLGAVRETADAMTQVQTTTADLAQQRQVTTGLSELQRLNAVRLASGLSTRLDLVGSDVRLLEAQQQAVNLEADQALARIRLIVAIGGGFDAASPPATPTNLSPQTPAPRTNP